MEFDCLGEWNPENDLSCLYMTFQRLVQKSSSESSDSLYSVACMTFVYCGLCTDWSA